MGNRATQIALTDEERDELERLTRKRTGAQALAFRARIILKANEKASNLRIAQALETSHATVAKWRARFAANRMDGLYDEPL